MITGRELDAKVYESLYDVKTCGDRYVEVCDAETGFAVPMYSTDRSETFRLIDAIANQETDAEEPKYFKILTPVNKDEGWVVEVVWALHDGDVPVCAAKGRTVSHAVCLAILDSGIRLPYPPKQHE